MGGSDSSKDPDPSNSNFNSYVSGSGSGAWSSKNRIRNTSNSNRNLASQDLEECLQTYTMPSFCPATAQPESNKSIYLLCLNYALASVNPYTQLTVLPGFWILVQSCNRWSAERAANIFVMLSANHLALSKNMNINQHNLSAFFSKKADRTLFWHC